MDISSYFSVNMVVRQGCTLASLLAFNTSVDWVSQRYFKIITEHALAFPKVAELFFANDATILSESWKV